MTRNGKFWLIRNFLVFRYNSEDLWCSIAYFRKGVKIYQSTCRCTLPPPPRNEKVEISGQCDILVLMISWASQWTRTPSATPLQPKKVKCSFLDYIQLLDDGLGLVDGLEHHLPPCLQPKKVKWSFLDYIPLLMVG